MVNVHIHTGCPGRARRHLIINYNYLLLLYKFYYILITKVRFLFFQVLHCSQNKQTCAVGIWSYLPSGRATVTSLHNNRSRGHRLFRPLVGFYRMVRKKKKTWIKGLRQESKEVWKEE